ncbi:unnamed protein product [Dibothriocephalus latus]|uniref:Uncharacterized protein n=1 Tax=Dibothriocephalus latus TaxID=60516 RepID=A0A3P6VEX3_DIBLA|nr:unnamed protein product [Dibothriocephalus latus]
MKRQNERMQKGLAALGPWVKKKNVSLNTKMLLWKTVANLKNIGPQGNMETTYYRLKKVLEDLKQDISDEDVDTAVRLALRRKVSLAGQLPKEEEAEEEEDEVDLVDVRTFSVYS